MQTGKYQMEFITSSKYHNNFVTWHIKIFSTPNNFKRNCQVTRWDTFKYLSWYLILNSSVTRNDDVLNTFCWSDKFGRYFILIDDCAPRKCHWEPVSNIFHFLLPAWCPCCYFVSLLSKIFQFDGHLPLCSALTWHCI